MKTFFFRRWVALPCSVLFSLVALATFAADEDSDIAEKSVLHVAEAPAKTDTNKTDTKSDSKKYELRYKLERGDVIRYEVTHRAFDSHDDRKIYSGSADAN